MGLRSFAMDNSYRGHLLDLDQIPGKEMRLYDRFSPLVNNSKNKRQLSFCYICPIIKKLSSVLNVQECNAMTTEKNYKS